MEELTPVQAIAICETEKCENSGHPIQVFVYPEGIVICGPCGVVITNIEPIAPEELQAVIK